MGSYHDNFWRNYITKVLISASSKNFDFSYKPFWRCWCKRPLLGPSQLKYGTDRQRTPLQDGDHSGNDPQLAPVFLRRCSGTVPESVRICGFKRNSSVQDSAPKMQDSVLMNSWDVFLVTLPSIASEPCVLYSSLIPGTDVFRDWLFLGWYSWVSLETAARFRLFLNIAIFLQEKLLNSSEDWIRCISQSTSENNGKWDFKWITSQNLYSHPIVKVEKYY